MDTFISFNIDYPNFTVNNQELILEGINNLFQEENFIKEVSIALVFMSDDALLVYNKEFLNHDYYTDIITFPIEETEEYLEADLLFSIDRIKDNAQQLNIESVVELNRVIIHGILHLVGYNDKTKKEQEIMRAKENYYLSKLSFL